MDGGEMKRPGVQEFATRKRGRIRSREGQVFGTRWMRSMEG